MSELLLMNDFCQADNILGFVFLIQKYYGVLIHRTLMTPSV